MKYFEIAAIILAVAYVVFQVYGYLLGYWHRRTYKASCLKNAELVRMDLCNATGKDITLPLPSDPAYVELMCELFDENERLHDLLAGHMYSVLAQYASTKFKYAGICELASYFIKKLRTDGLTDYIDVIAAELRGLLFGLYMANQDNGDLFVLSCQLLCACFNIDEKEAYMFEKILSFHVVAYRKVPMLKYFQYPFMDFPSRREPALPDDDQADLSP